MVTEIRTENCLYGGSAVKRLFCLSTDTKPTAGVANGSELEELNVTTNTLTLYKFNEAAAQDSDKWVPVASVTYTAPENQEAST